MNKKHLFFLTALCSMLLLLFACRKDINHLMNQNAVSSDDLETAKVYFSANSKPVTINGKTYRLKPKWNDSWAVKTNQGQLVVIPMGEKRINSKDVTIRRLFLFNVANNQVRNAELVEFQGNKYDVTENLEMLAANYQSNFIKGFNGAIFEYDINYGSLRSAYYDNGQKLNNVVVDLITEKGSSAIVKQRLANNSVQTLNSVLIRFSDDWKSLSCEGGTIVYDRVMFYDQNHNLVEIFFDWISETCPPPPPTNTGGGSSGDLSAASSSSAEDSGDPGYGGPSGGGAGSGGGGGGHTVDALMKDKNALTDAEKTALDELIRKIKLDCLGATLVNYMTSNNIKFDWAINSSMSNPAQYNTGTDAITIKGTNIDQYNLAEELFHAYQNKTMTGGTGQYYNNPGHANIEFESKVMKDANAYVNGTTGFSMAVIGQSYQTFIDNITASGTKLPTNFTSAQQTDYFAQMNTWRSQNPGYANAQISNTMLPQAFFNLTNSSPCAK